MKIIIFHLPSIRSGVLAAFVFLSAVMLQATPDWWNARGVIDAGAVEEDSAMLSQGQLKHVTAKAIDELNEKLSGGAGVELTTLLSSWTAAHPDLDDTTAMSIGQVKYIASLVFAELVASGNDEPLTAGDNNTKPSALLAAWNVPGASDNDNTAASIGQMKYLFSWELPVVLDEFDFAIIRYRWTAAGGDDLDTRTAIIQPALDPSFYDNPAIIDVGWARGSTVPNSGAAASEPYLAHGGDNRDDGVEAVLFDLQKLRADNPSVNTIEVRLRAFWYGSLVSGNLQIEFETYQGGTMNQVGFDFVNSGGQLVDQIIVNRNTQLQQSGDIDGSEMGKLIYDFNTNEATITSPVQAPQGFAALSALSVSEPQQIPRSSVTK
ncbi:hypothetical protein [Rubellicoccus peritrichatus]|uniref:Uncharacterized protein n=1 Tax=Rubellicoccus peritrichatus TaxID=3080537 RepID=A0AAQ3QWP0_9BACT|nr:hypothetical protein [Puniceicoccus sp. CR14]WOO42092.1 hypothetical protein RZN69_03260 [Puniceicoccus sp. CR14]